MNLKNSSLLILVALVLTSCGSSKQVNRNNAIEKSLNLEQGEVISAVENKKIKGSSVIKHNVSVDPATKTTSNIITTALSFEGTRYKYGGFDQKGMDCSGLVYTCYKGEDIELPRSSKDMARLGVKITLDEIAKGDLVFFITGNKQKTINHVGLVVEIDNGVIKFIHSTTSLGVIISSMEESYWKKSFVEVRRMI